jgi:hypothetical protein
MGAALAFQDPSGLRIEDFSQLYQRLGLSDTFMLIVFLALPLATALAASFIVLLRRPGDRGAVVLAAGLSALFLFYSGFVGLINADWIRQGTTSLALVLVTVLFTTFPTGTYQPRWSVIAPVTAAGVCMLNLDVVARLRELFNDPDAMSGSQRTAAALTLAGVVLTILIAQTVRYRDISTNNERHQSRWFILGILSMVLPPTVLLVLISLGFSRPWLTAGLVAFTALGSYAFQGAVLIAIFRHHLYEIDRIVSRTVTYGVVALAVSTVYGGLVLLLPAVLEEADSLVIALATLTAAAVFHPIRVRVQRVVDRRFNRSRYDAGQELAKFVGRLPDYVDGDVITEDLRTTLNFTFEPRALSIWIRES